MESLGGVRIVIKIVKFPSLTNNVGVILICTLFVGFVLCGGGKGVNRQDRFVTDWIREE